MINKIINLLAKVTYGLVLPFFLLYIASTAHYNSQNRKSLEKAKSRMQDHLDLLINYHDDKVFLHSILQKNFNIADKSATPNKVLKTMLNAFKARFPNCFKFIVWDNNGRIIDDLSDEHKYRYLMKITYQFLNELHKKYVQNPEASADSIKFVRDKTNILRVYFGDFFVDTLMKFPLLKGYLGKCISTSPKYSKYLLWYQVGKNFSIVCLISRKLKNKNIGIKALINRFNRQNKLFKLGALDLIKNRVIGSKKQEESRRFIYKTNLYKFSTSSSDFIHSPEYITLARQVSTSILVFCYAKRKNLICNVKNKRGIFLFTVLKFLLILIFVYHCYTIKSSNAEIKVKNKLFALLVFSAFLSVMTLTVLSYEFFDYKQKAIINSEQKKSESILREFNLSFPIFRESIARSTTNFLEKFNQKFRSKPWDETTLAKVSSFLKNMQPSEFFLIGQDEHAYLRYNSSNFVLNETFIKKLFLTFLNFFNGVSKRKAYKRANASIKLLGYYKLVWQLPENLDRISLQNYSSSQRWLYLKILGNYSINNFWGFLSVIWSKRNLQKQFIESKLTEINKQIYPRVIITMDEENEIIAPKQYHQVKNILHRTISRKRIVDNKVIINNKRYILTSLIGTELPHLAIAAIYPEELVENKIHFIKMIFLFVVSIFFIITYIIIRFSQQIFIKPLSNIECGVKHLHDQNYEFEIQSNSKDEFGDLINLVNETSLEMKKLAIGTAIQRQLLPKKYLVSKHFELFADTAFMTKMGGDYFDYFELDENKLCIFFGDVAGHGIPAGIMMAMAKSVIENEKAEFFSPSNLLSKMNDVFIYIRKKNWKRAMTCLCVSLEVLTGNFILANAGQCYPIIVSDYGKKVRYIKATGFILGVRTSKGYNEISENLGLDETLVFYSDGIIEATNSQGKMLGYVGFEKLLKESWNRNLSIFWQNLFEGHNNWAKKQDDDITFLLIRRLNE